MRSIFICALLVSVSVIFSRVLHADVPASDLAVSFQQGGNLKTDDVATLVGGFIWKMQVTLPQGTKTISVGVDNGSGNNGLMAPMSTDISDATIRQTVLVAVIPLEGSITTASKLRIALVIRTETGHDTGCLSTAGEVDNPFKNAAIYQTTTPPRAVARGEFGLIEGQKRIGENSSPPFAAICLHISAN